MLMLEARMLILSAAWELKSKDVPTFSIEISIFIVGCIAGIIGLFIWKNHRLLAKKGLPECIFGFFIFAIHSLFDALDTICHIDPLDEMLDLWDSLFSIIGLLLIAIGILRISLYGAKIWREL
ncbi:MAG: hypothetical protein ACTSRS_01400 [Candidatus Helarchaeota archaeon]